MTQLSLMPARQGRRAEPVVILTDERHVHPSDLRYPHPAAFCTICGRETHDGTAALRCIAALRKGGRPL